MSEVNIPLLRKAVEWAEAEAAKPVELREWEQQFFVLPVSDSDIRVEGMTWMPSFDREALNKAPECGTCYCIAGYVDAISSDEPAHYREIEQRAADLLGLNASAALDLFDAGNSIEDVRRIAESIAGESL